MNPMFWFYAMRQTAYYRHWWYNQVYEGGDPVRWQWHLAMLRAFYG